MPSPPNNPTKIPDKPFESSNVMAEEAARVLREQRKASGNLPDQPPDNPVKDVRSFRVRK